MGQQQVGDVGAYVLAAVVRQIFSDEGIGGFEGLSLVPCCCFGLLIVLAGRESAVSVTVVAVNAPLGDAAAHVYRVDRGWQGRGGVVGHPAEGEPLAGGLGWEPASPIEKASSKER